MGITIASPVLSIPRVAPAMVQVKRAWSDDWQTVPELEFVAGGVATGGERAYANFRRRYGTVKLPWESGYSAKAFWFGLAGWWVRVMLYAPKGYRQAWIGRFTAQPSAPHSPQANGAAGHQELVAEGPERILERVKIDRTFYWDADAADVIELGWPMDFNADERGDFVWNRHEEQTAFTFDIADFWNPKQIIEYLLERFLSVDDQPTWTLDGLTEQLEEDWDAPSISCADRPSVGDVLGQLLSRTDGLDYVIRQTAQGFSVYVFSVFDRDYGWAGTTIRGNSSRVPLDLSSDKPASVRIVHDHTHRYKKIRVLGDRIVVCASLYGADVLDPDKLDGTLHPYAGSLTKLWDAGLEAEYKTASEEQRNTDKFRAVWTHYGPPSDWDFHEGACSPSIDPDGQVDAANPLPYQRHARATLDWLPLFAGVDYTQDPPVWPDEEQQVGDRVPPAAYVGGLLAPEEPLTSDEQQIFALAERLGVDVSIDLRDLAVYLDQTPRHWFADGRDTGWGTPPEQPGVADYDKLVVTLAWQTDHTWGYEVADDDWVETDGVHEVHVEGAACHVLAPRTVVGLRENGQLQESPDAHVLLRLDTEAILGRLPGVFARYFADRPRATVEFLGLAPWADLLGQMLQLVDGANGLIAPINSVQWRNDAARPITRITAGYAR